MSHVAYNSGTNCFPGKYYQFGIKFQDIQHSLLGIQHKETGVCAVAQWNKLLPGISHISGPKNSSGSTSDSASC